MNRLKTIRTYFAGAFAVLLLLAAGALAISGCTKDEFNTDADFRLTFSNDTVIFDTVFTTIGSSTRALVVHNESQGRITIASVKLARGSSSPFRINVDGFSSLNAQNIEIGSHDSAYIFVKVTIDPNQSDNPLVETDSILFEVNGNRQNVKLVAWGQDAFFHLNETLTGVQEFTGDKPHVVYGRLTAADGCKLTLAAGTRMYFHNSGSLEIRKGASLQVNGTLENPVKFAYDRLEKDYLDVPGLWDGIWLEKGSSDNRFTYAEIRNPKVGLQADTVGNDSGGPLILYNCLVSNTLNYGLYFTNCQVRASNCEITNSGANLVAIENGGAYDFRSCTFGNFWPWTRRFASISVSNAAGDAGSNLDKAYFGNCIIWGNLESEIEFYKSKDAAAVFNPKFENCLVKWVENAGEKTQYFADCIFNKDAKFKDPYKLNFTLDTLSPAKDVANMSIITSALNDLTHDRKGISRIADGKPDLGAYERVEKPAK